MPIYSAGPFKIDVWEGGYPVWINVRGFDDHETVLKFSHRELADFVHVVKQAQKAAIRILPDNKKLEAE